MSASRITSVSISSVRLAESPRELQDQIRHIEEHLARVGDADDSACEKALIRTYEYLLHQCHEKLAALPNAAHNPDIRSLDPAG
jgi:hypothetical protein